jgi:hypothetical protein
MRNKILPQQLFKLLLNKSILNKTMVLLLSFLLIIESTYSQKVPYLEDADTTTAALNQKISSRYAELESYPFPRLSNHVWSPNAFTPEQMSKFKVVSCDGTHIEQAVLLKQKYPEIVSLRYFRPTAYQAEMWSMPFLGTGAATNGKNVYAGHWLYTAGTTTENYISAAEVSVKVTDISSFSKGSYVVIYDAPAGSFKNAEHAYVSDVDVSTKTLSLSKRGVYSTATDHAAKSIIAAHVFGDDDYYRNKWSYNLSSACPRDANNNTLWQALADWLGANLNTNAEGVVVKAYDGIIFDTDNWRTAGTNDVDDDLIPDGGFIDTLNTWNAGLELFYKRLRTISRTV